MLSECFCMRWDWMLRNLFFLFHPWRYQIISRHKIHITNVPVDKDEKWQRNPIRARPRNRKCQQRIQFVRAKCPTKQASGVIRMSPVHPSDSFRACRHSFLAGPENEGSAESQTWNETCEISYRNLVLHASPQLHQRRKGLNMNADEQHVSPLSILTNPKATEQWSEWDGRGRHKMRCQTRAS